MILGQAGIAQAQIDYEEKEVTFTMKLSVNTLRCVIPLGHPNVETEDRVFTEFRRHTRSIEEHSAVEMSHGEARLKGCEIEVLDRLKRHVLTTSFGHTPVDITVIKGTAREPRFVFGKCQRNYREEVKIDFGENIILTTSRRGKLKPATGCKQDR